MSLAVEHFQAVGWRVEDTSADHPYDLRCTRDRQGATSRSRAQPDWASRVNLTAGEVRHHRQNPLRAVLFVAHTIDVAWDVNGLRTSGGRVYVIEPWDVDAGRLEPTAFVWRPSDTPRTA
jgi:hypothetical protein